MSVCMLEFLFMSWIISRPNVLLNSAGFVEDYTFREFRDAGISCAWNPAGNCIAAGSQDGTVVVWDARAHMVRLLHAEMHFMNRF